MHILQKSQHCFNLFRLVIEMNALRLIGEQKIIFAFLILIVYYEIRIFRIAYCENKTSFENNSKYSEREDVLLQLSDQINNFLRFGDEYQNFILSLLYEKNKNHTILLNSQDIDIIEDLNKY